MFVLTALDVADRAIFILPTGILSPQNKEEEGIIQNLVDKNIIETIIVNPDNMFESTAVGTCIIVFNKNKTNTKVMMIDAREEFVIDEREQKGQFGGKSHTNRTYTKQFKAYSEQNINKILLSANNKKVIDNFSTVVNINIIKENNYDLRPSEYINFEHERETHREIQDIVNDYNRLIKRKNALKLSINETIAKQFNLDEVHRACHKLDDTFPTLLKSEFGIILENDNYITLTKNKNEIKFENVDKERVSEILMVFLQMWGFNIQTLNNESNILLGELRDALIDGLFSQKFVLNDED